MKKNKWYTSVWGDSAKTIPSTRSVWLNDSQLLSVYDDGCVFTASSGNWKMILEDCHSWVEAQKGAVMSFRKELTGRMRKLVETIDFLDNSIEQEAEEQVMGKVEQAVQKQNLYLLQYGRPTEEDHSLNDANRELILAMNERYGHVFVGTFNGEIALVQYDGGKIYNSAYDFCVPDYDEQLDKLLHLWKKEYRVCQLEAIQKRIDVLGGHRLLWV